MSRDHTFKHDPALSWASRLAWERSEGIRESNAAQRRARDHKAAEEARRSRECADGLAQDERLSAAIVALGMIDNDEGGEDP